MGLQEERPMLDSDLTAAGVEQAGRVGLRLAEESFQFQLAVSSDLVRARDTAVAIIRHQPGLQLQQWQLPRYPNTKHNKCRYCVVQGAAPGTV